MSDNMTDIKILMEKRIYHSLQISEKMTAFIYLFPKGDGFGKDDSIYFF